MKRMIPFAAAMSLVAGGAHAQQTAEPTPTPDAARLWRGTVYYRVTMNGDTTGADTATWSVAGGQLVAVDRMHLPGIAAAVEARMSLPSLAPLSLADVRDAGGQHAEARLAYAGGRVTGTLAMPGAAPAGIDEALPEGTYDMAGLASVLASMPLRAGAVWTLPAYSPYLRAVTRLRAEVGAPEVVETPMGPVRAFRVRLTGGPAEMLYWFSEAEPRWEVKGAIPAYGITIEARSRTP
jgi:hypothetical protein